MGPTREVTVALRLQSQMQAAARDLDAIAGKLDKVRQAGTDANSKGGLDALGQGARDTAQAVDAARSTVDKLAQSIKAASSAGSGQSPFIAALRDQVALYGKGTDEALKYRAAQAGVAAEAAPLILQLQNIRAAQEAAASAALAEADAQRQAAQAKQQQTAQSAAFVAGLREQVALQGKSAADVLRYRAAQAGVSTEAEQYIAQIAAFDAASGRGSKALDKFGQSAGQTQQALRLLPAQFTDIGTSIAGGIPFWLVAIQQGGQISDSFGGVRNAGRALLGLLTPLRLAVGGAAAVMLLAAVAATQVEKEQAAYSAAIVATNNAAGVSKGQLQDYARQVSAVAGTTGAAASAVAQLAGTGRVAGADLAAAATVAVRAQKLLGREVAVTVKEFAELGRDPVAALLKLNEGTNFVTASVLKQVMALKSQGQNQAAAALAQKAYLDEQTRVLADAEKNLGTLEKAWKGVAGAAKGAWDAMLNLGRPETLQEQLDAVNKALAAAPRRGGSTLDVNARRAAMEERKAAIEESIRLEKQAAAKAAEQTKKNQADLDELSAGRQAARASIAKALQDQNLAQVQAGLAKAREATQAAFARDEVDAQDHQAILLAIDRAGIDAQIANLDKLRGIEAGRLTSTQDDALAKEASLIALKTQRVALEQQLVSLQAQERSGARDIAPKARSLPGDALRAFKATDEANVEAATNPLTKAQVDLEALQGRIDRIFSAQQRAQKDIALQVQTYAISEIEGKKRVLELNAQTADSLDELLPKMAELAARTGDPRIADGFENLKQQVTELRVRTDELKVAFAGAFEGGLKTALVDLASGTKSLGDAARDFVLSIANAMAQLAAQKLAEQATSGVMGGVDATVKAVQGLIPAFGQAAAAKAAADAAMTASGVAATATAATAATAAGVQVAAANAPAAAAASTWSFGAAAVAGLAALAAILVFAKGSFATGGYTGPGGKYQPAGIVHKDEFVHRKEVVRQPGALAFLSQFNRVGMAALADWQGVGLGQYAEGGLVMDRPARASSAANYQPAEPASASNVALQQRLLPVLDPDLISDALRGPAGEQLLVLHISRNPGKFRSLLKVGA